MRATPATGDESSNDVLRSDRKSIKNLKSPGKLSTDIFTYRPLFHSGSWHKGVHSFESGQAVSCDTEYLATLPAAVRGPGGRPHAIRHNLSNLWTFFTSPSELLNPPAVGYWGDSYSFLICNFLYISFFVSCKNKTSFKIKHVYSKTNFLAANI